jgi:DMSO/TMAO reductase YedYZ heme-binding membrane subunit
VVHYIWLVKKDVRLPVIYATVLGILLLYRIFAWYSNRATATQTATRGAGFTPQHPIAE